MGSNLEYDALFRTKCQADIVKNADGNPARAENLRGTVHFEEHVNDDCQSRQRKNNMAKPIAASPPIKIMVDHRQMQQHKAGQRAKIHDSAEIIQAVGKK